MRIRQTVTGLLLRTALPVLLVHCSLGCDPATGENGGAATPDWQQLRVAMVQKIKQSGVRDERVLQAMLEVPRHRFTLPDYQAQAYDDSSLPIGDGQSTPEPWVVALMAEHLEVEPGSRVLEIGTGSGYQAAVLAAMGAEVFTIEIRPGLCERARETLQELHYLRATVRCGDGYNGWPEEAPFDGILVTAAPEEVPEPLLDQLADGARMVIPLGPFYQDLKVITRTADGLQEQSVIPVRFKGIDRTSSDDSPGDRGHGDRGREDRGREDRGREDRGQEDQGRGDQGHGDQQP